MMNGQDVTPTGLLPKGQQGCALAFLRVSSVRYLEPPWIFVLGDGRRPRPWT